MVELDSLVSAKALQNKQMRKQVLIMWANPLNPGDTIGIISPSHTVTPDDYAKIISGIEAKGFRVKMGSRLYRHTYGYAASETERADDLNEMVSDKDVKLVLFGGGYGSIELLPYICLLYTSPSPRDCS